MTKIHANRYKNKLRMLTSYHWKADFYPLNLFTALLIPIPASGTEARSRNWFFSRPTKASHWAGRSVTAPVMAHRVHILDAPPPQRPISNKQLPGPSWADTLVPLLFRISFSISARSAEPSRGMTANVWNNWGSTAILTRLSSSSWTWGIFPFI